MFIEDIHVTSFFFFGGGGVRVRSGIFRLKVSITSGKIWPKNKLLRRTKICYKIKRLKIEHKWLQTHTYFISLTCHPCISNSKTKIERMSPKFWLTTNHHLGEWKISFNLRKKSGILLMLGCRFPPKFPNPRTLHWLHEYSSCSCFASMLLAGIHN